MKQRSTTLTLLNLRSNEQSKGMREHDISLPEKNKISKALLIFMLLVCLGINSFAQTMKTYPTSLSADASVCNSTVTKTFTIENRGADALTYSNSISYDVNTDKAGTSLAEYTNFPESTGGMVLIDHFLYVVNYDNYSLDKYDITSKTLVASYSIHSYPWGIAYDGTYLWIGQYENNKIFNYDLSGNAVGSSITMPVYNFILTYDGQNFVVAVYGESNPTIYKVNHAGSTVKTYSSSGIDYPVCFTWVPEHTGAQLWVIDDGDNFRQIKLSNSVAEVVNSFYFYDWNYAYSIVHDGKDFWIGDWDGALNKVDDGIDENANFISLSNTTGTVSSGLTTTITVTFNTNGLVNGQYTGTITVNSNDPNNSSVEIPYTLYIESNPIISLSASTLNFGNVFYGATSTKSLWIHNTGCSALSVSNISSSSINFSVNTTSFDIEVGDSVKFDVTYAPTAVGASNAMLTITSNTKEAKVFLTGTAIAPPVLSVSPKEISASITECSGTATKTFAIANNGNTGCGDLAFANTANFIDESKRGNVINDYSFVDYNTGMVFVGNYIYAVSYNDNELVKYDKATLSVLNTYSIHAKPMGIAYDGEHLWIASYYGFIQKYDLSGKAIGSPINLPFSNNDPALTFNGEDLLIAQCYTNNPIIYRMDLTGSIVGTYNSDLYNIFQFSWSQNSSGGHLWVKDDFQYVKEVSIAGNNAITVYSFDFNEEVYTIAHDGTNLWLGLWNYGVLLKVDDGIVKNAINLSTYSGTTAKGSSTNIGVNFNTVVVASGVYKGNILIASNDPSNAIDTVTYTLTIAGSPVMKLSSTSINFGNVFNGQTANDTLWVHNTGCDTLKISDINGLTVKFAVSDTSFIVLPYDSTQVLIAFTPETNGNYGTTLTITSNVADATVSLAGTGIEPPVLSVDPKSLSATVSCGETTTKTFTITNSGANNLAYSIDSVGTSSASNLGTVLGSYSGFNSYCRGMVYVDGYLYAVHTDYNQLDKYDISTQSVVASYSIHGNAAGIAYDGKDLWIGCQDGHLYNYDLSGNSIGSSISLPFSSSWPALAYDGQYFIVAPCYNSGANIYKVDHSGAVIETYAGSYFIYAMAWASKHSNGHLWIEDNTNYLRQVNLSGGAATTINSVAFSGDITSLSHDGKDLWIGHYGGTLQRVDDGVTESTFYSLSSYRGTVSTTPSTITVTFAGGNLTSGTYTDNIFVRSNDPTNTVDTVACTFTITGSPAINLSKTSIDFGKVVNGQTVNEDIWLFNTGCDTLRVSNISGTTSELSVDATTFNVMPYDSVKLAIGFAPSTSGSYSTSLTITSNVSDVTISLTGEGDEAPVLTVDPKSITASINDCNGTTSETFTITNNGGADLTYNNTVSFFNSTIAGNVLNNYDNYPDYTPGMVMVGKYIYAVVFDMMGDSYLIKYDTETQQVVSSKTLIIAPFGITYDGQHLWIGSFMSSQVSEFDLDGNATGSSFTLPFSGMPGLAFDGQYIIALNRNGSNPTFYKMSTDGTVIESYTSSFSNVYAITWVTKQNALWLFTNNQLIETTLSGGVVNVINSLNFSTGSPIYSLAHDGTNLWCGEIEGNLYTVEDGIDEDLSFISLSSGNGTLTSSGMSTITANFDAHNIKAGIYNGSIIVSSNDPTNAIDTVTFELSVSGAPIMNLSATSFNFGNVFVGANPKKELLIKNNGCDTLKISDANGLIEGFTLSDTAGIVLPYDSVKVTITCSPKEIGNLNATITIVSNLPDVTISLSAVGVASPELLVDPTSLSATVSCGGSATKTFTIKNTGDGNLTYSTLGFIDDVESSNNVWTTEVYGGTTDDLWHKSHLNYHSSNTSWWCGIEATGNYENGNTITTALISPEIDLTQTSASVLDFWENYQTEGGSWDGCMVDISIDGGKTWSQLRGEGVNGSSEGWINTSLDLTPYCGNLVKIRFYFDTRDGEANDYSGWFIDDIMVAGASSSTNSWNWITLSDKSGTIASDGTKDVTVNFNASGLNAGIYTKNIYVISNDPENLIDTVACSFTVEGGPGLELSKSSISFPSVFVNSSSTGTLTITNPGCDTLKISSITTTLIDFVPSTGAMNILPGKSEKLTVTFAPHSAGLIEGSITLFNNVKDSTINLSGTGIVPSIVSVSSITEDGFYNEGNAINLVVTYNTEVSVNTSGGTPRIALNTTPTGYANFLMNYDSRSLIFQYMVGADDNSSDLDYTDVKALTLENGIITDLNSTAADTTLPTIGTFAADHSIVIDNVHPTVTLSSTAASVTAQNPFHVKIDFSEKVAGLTLGGISVGNGTASNLQTSDYITWTIDVTPTANGAVTVDLLADAALDLAGNGNVAADQLTRTYDSTLPVLMLTTTANPTNVSPIAVTISSNVSVTNLELTDVNVTNGTASNLTEVTAGTQWTVDVTPTAEGNVTVTIPAGAVLNASSNANPESAELSIKYDASAPTVTISSESSNPTNIAPIEVSVLFNEEIKGFELEDVTVGNGSAFYMEPGSDNEWIVYIAPTASGLVTVDVAANKVKDIAGNSNTAATQFSITYDNVLPVIDNLEVANIANTSVNALFTCNKNAEVYYAVLVSGSEIPTANQILAGTVSVIAGHTTVTKDIAKSVAISGLATKTTYAIYSVAVDIFNNVSEIETENFTTTNVDVDIVTESEITIYPNPVSTTLQISISNSADKARYELYSITGQLMTSGLIENGNASVSMDSYSPSMYILRIFNGNKLSTHKVVKQ